MRVFVLLLLTMLMTRKCATQNGNATVLSYDKDYKLDNESSYTDDYYESGSGDYFVVTNSTESWESGDERTTDDDEDKEDGSGDDYLIPVGERWECGDGLILSDNKRCDGVPDCGDCSDEIGCITTETDKLFFCYDHDPIPGHVYTRDDDPYCVERHRFCNAHASCKSGADRRTRGFGAKCRVVRQESCLLTPQLIADSTPDCEGGVDMLLRPDDRQSGDDSKSVPSVVGYRPLGEEHKEKMFKCLSEQQVFIFKQQVCDGVLDCPDFSDECLCGPVDERVAAVCDNSTRLGHRRASCRCGGEEGCDDVIGCECDGGEVRVERRGNGTTTYACVATHRVCEGDGDPELERICDLTAQVKVETREMVRCLAHDHDDGELVWVNAVMCDGSPECWFGDDECLDQCHQHPGFCRLWHRESGYTCQKTEGGDEMDARVCDGNADCLNGTDEAGCPKDSKISRKDQTSSSSVTRHCIFGSRAPSREVTTSSSRTVSWWFNTEACPDDGCETGSQAL